MAGCATGGVIGLRGMYTNVITFKFDIIVPLSLSLLLFLVL